MMLRSEPKRAVLLIAPQVPPYGGMALQAQQLQRLLNGEGVAAVLVASNPPFPPWARFLERVRGLRALLREVVFCAKLWQALPQADVVHILACSWLYFFFIVYPSVAISRLRDRRVILNYRGGEAQRFFRWFGWAAKPVFRLRPPR